MFISINAQILCINILKFTNLNATKITKQADSIFINIFKINAGSGKKIISDNKLDTTADIIILCNLTFILINFFKQINKKKFINILTHISTSI